MSLESPRATVQFICSPIGNLGDLTYRAVECLKKADIIACEDTRQSRKLLNHYGIEQKELVALHDHNEASKSIELTERLDQIGGTLAVLSDAGSPTISDPGYRLIQVCIDKEFKIEVLPGPSAVITGLIGSGLPTDQFRFRGFLPVKSGKKEKVLREAIENEGTSIFFESPHRILKTLNAIAELDKSRRICVARELTKKFETYHRGTAAEVLSGLSPGPVKGEITLLIEGTTRSHRREQKRRSSDC